MNLVFIVGSLFVAAAGGPVDLEFLPQSGWKLHHVAAEDPNQGNAADIARRPVPVNLQDLPKEIKFARFSPLSEEFSLSHGFRTKESWFVSAVDIPGLELILPKSASGVLALKVKYYGRNSNEHLNEPLVEHSLLIDLRDPRSQTNPASASLPRNAGPEVPPAGVRVSAKEEKTGLDQAYTLIKAGDVAAARLLFEDLAHKGSGAAARALAETYDPVYLKQMFRPGLQPNPETAKKWYQFAADLGDRESSIRLSGLR